MIKNVRKTVRVVYEWPIKESTTSNDIETYIQEQRHILQNHMYSLHPTYQNDGKNPYPAHQSTILHTIQVFLHFQTTELGIKEYYIYLNRSAMLWSIQDVFYR